MRKLLALLPVILLTGCRLVLLDPKPVENSPPVTVIARGTDGINRWDCQVQSLNSTLVWVECRFTNTWTSTAGNSWANSCIQVRFFSEESSKLVVESPKICSGPLHAGNISFNYAAFQKENRVTLRSCGELLDLCTMLAEPAR
jgi:hypothetical protein